MIKSGTIFIFSIVLLMMSCAKQEKANSSKEDTFDFITKVESFNYKQLKPLLEKEDNKTYVVNFWATWCAPCVKELPAFEKIGEEYKNKNVEVVLVSLDFPKHVEKRLIPFINKKKLQSKVVLLDDANEDYWIKAIDSTWSGALPATLIYNAKQRKFFERNFEYETLEKELQTFL